MKLRWLSQYRGLRKEIYVLFFGRIVTNLGSMVWPMLTLILRQKLGLSAANISLVTVGAGLLMVPMNLLGGRLADRWNKKHIIVAGDSVSVACYLLCGLLPLNGATVALMLLAAMCQSLEGPAYNALIADLSTTRDRDRAFSLQYLGANLGLVLSPTLAGLLFRDYLWLSFLLSGAAIGCSTVLIVRFIRDIRPEPDEGAEAVYQAAREGQSLSAVLRGNRLIVLFLVSQALDFAAYQQYSFLMPLELGRLHGENGAVLFGTVNSLNCLVVVLFTPLITRLTAAVSEPRKLLWGQALLGGGYLVFLLFLGCVPVYYLAMLLFTWGEIVSTIAQDPYMTRRIPASHRGRLNGFNAVLSFLLQSVFQLIVGWMYDRSGSSPAWSAVLLALALAAALTLLLDRRDRQVYPKLYTSL